MLLFKVICFKAGLLYEGQSISNETFSITQVCNDW